MVHSFFAGMGGFVVDTKDVSPYIPGSPRLVITANGVLILAEHGHITDKSKADIIAKALALVQGCWLLVQCIGRVATHLPLTLLEINTLAHVICMLFIYRLWMKKPYDVHEPYLLAGEWVRPFAATLWMFSKVSTRKRQEGRHHVVEAPEIERLVYLEASTISYIHLTDKNPQVLVITTIWSLKWRRYV